MAMWPYYLHCRSCHSRFRVETLDPHVGPGYPTFCPKCGCRALTETDRKLDYWYILAEGFGFEPTQRGVDLVKGLYELWDPTEHARFGDFVSTVRKEHEVEKSGV